MKTANIMLLDKYDYIGEDFKSIKHATHAVGVFATDKIDVSNACLDAAKAIVEKHPDELYIVPGSNTYSIKVKDEVIQSKNPVNENDVRRIRQEIGHECGLDGIFITISCINDAPLIDDESTIEDLSTGEILIAMD